MKTFFTRITFRMSARLLIWYWRENSMVAPVSFIWCFDCRKRRMRRGLSPGDCRLEFSEPSKLEDRDRGAGGTLIESISMELTLEVRDLSDGGSQARGEVGWTWRNSNEEGGVVAELSAEVKSRLIDRCAADLPDLSPAICWLVSWSEIFRFGSMEWGALVRRRGIDELSSFSNFIVWPTSFASGSACDGDVTGAGGVMTGCTSRSCMPGITNSGMSLRICDFLLKMLNPSLGVFASGWSLLVAAFWRRHLRRNTTAKTTTKMARARPREAGTSARRR